VTRLISLLATGNRDLRIAVARALRSLCNPEAIEPLTAHHAIEPSVKVKSVIFDVLRDLHQCR
jgi:hypothetical protein